MNKRIKKKQQKRMKENQIHPNVEVKMIDVTTFTDFDVMDAETACSIMNHPSDLEGVPAEDIVAMTTPTIPPLDGIFTPTAQKELDDFFSQNSR